MKNILITAGGTGGHIFPASALANQLVNIGVNILFVGGNLNSNVFFDKEKFPYKEVSCGKFTKKAFFVKGFLHLIKGVLQSLKIIRLFEPDVVVGFGSFYTAPVIIAAKMLSIPIVLHESNTIPGKVTKYFSRISKVTCINFSSTRSYVKGRVVEVGVPLREGFNGSFSFRTQAIKYFNLDPCKFTFLVFGGSQGALKLNMDFTSALMQLKAKTKKIQVIHLTGSDSISKEVIKLYEELGIISYVKSFEEKMDLAWSCGDLVISRAGALSIAEQIEFEVPGILIPYPYATDDHQSKNADFMVEEVQGAIKLLESECEPTAFADIINDILANKEKLIQMKKAIQKYKKNRHIKEDLCSVVCKIAEASI